MVEYVRETGDAGFMDLEMPYADGGSDSVWAHLHHKQTIADLKEEISFYDKAYQRDQRRIRELQTNPKAMEKIARERYFMKTSDEDIFVLSDDEEYYNQKRVSSDETVE